MFPNCSIKRHLTAILLFVVSINFNAYAQATQNLSTIQVKVDLTAYPITIDPVPYEKKINLVVTVAPEVYAATVHYKTKKNLLLLDKFNDQADGGKAINKKVVLTCNGLQANKEYTFTFTLFKTADSTDVSDLAKKVAGKLKNFIDAGDFGVDASKHLEADLKDIVKEQTPDGKIYDKSLKEIDLAKDLDIKNDLANYTTDLNQIKKDKGEIAGKAKVMLESELTNDLKDVFHKLDDPANLLPNSQEIFKRKLRDTGRFKDMTMADVNTYFKHLLDDPATFESIINGKKHFHSGGYINSGDDGPDVEYLILLDEFVNKVAAVDWKANQVLGTNGLKDLNDNIIPDFYKFLSDYQEIADKQKDLAGIDHSLKQKLASFLISNLIKFKIDETVSVTADASPYISLDAGAGYNRSFSTFYTNYGVNIYFVPVDKSIPLKTYDGNILLRILKTTSIDIGIINNYFNSDNVSKRYVALLGGSKDLFLGLGVRINRVLKINLGADCYNLHVSDPVSTHSYLNAKFVAGMALDINIIKAFGGVASAFGFN